MKNIPAKVFLVCFLFIGTLASSFGQVVTSGPDSTLVSTGQEPAAPRQKGLSKPGKAALMSAVVPGLGQAYNKSYWKIPIIYATGGVLGYFLHSNTSNYQKYKQAIALRLNTPDSLTVEDEFTSKIGSRPMDQQLTVLRRNRDNFRRWRDYNIMYCIIAYGLNITEAYVHAHLKGFDVGEELSLKIRPDFIQTTPYTFTPAFSLSINFKK
ncbi:MAG: DUF5683 domain-containing protein [Adhaeribacter sp.]